MEDKDRRRRWRTPRYVASIWYCGDEYCNCTEPRLEIVTPNLKGGFPWVRREKVWAGTFRTDGEGSTEEWQAELEPVAKQYGITLDENLYGEAPFTRAPAPGRPTETDRGR